MAVSGTNIFAGTRGGGVWRRPLAEMVSVEKNTTPLMVSAGVLQSLPNPFNPSTLIEYSLPETQNGLLSVYSADGSLILKQAVRGRGTFTWNAGKLASGIYVCRLTAGEKVFSKKMMLLR